MTKITSELAQAMFDPLVGATFHIVTGDHQTVSVELIESTALTPQTTRDDLPIRADPFSLVFKGDRDMTMAQQIYEVRHPDLGSFELFLVPIGFGEYEAVFN